MCSYTKLKPRQFCFARQNSDFFTIIWVILEIGANPLRKEKSFMREGGSLAGLHSRSISKSKVQDLFISRKFPIKESPNAP